MNTYIRRKLYTALYCALGTAALCTLSTAVEAMEPGPPTKTVRYADLNIQTPEGAKVLYGRIRSAARDVCDISVGHDSVLNTAKKACFEKAIDNAVRKVDAPYLTALRFGSSNIRLASK